MRLSKEMIDYLAHEIIKSLEEKGLIEIERERELVVHEIGSAIREELSTEDKLDNEVKDILDAYEKRLDKEGVDYRKMFLMIKNKLVREREIVL